jgi:MSHA pilin protein MshD
MEWGMHTKPLKFQKQKSRPAYSQSMRLAKGVSLIELITFMVVISIAMVTLASVFRHSMSSIQAPISQQQLLSFAEAKINLVMAYRFDEASLPNEPCGLNLPCIGIGLESAESHSDMATLDDMDDFDGYVDEPQAGFNRQVRVSYMGSALGINQNFAKQVSVTVTSPTGESINLNAYKVNH